VADCKGASEGVSVPSVDLGAALAVASVLAQTRSLAVGGAALVGLGALVTYLVPSQQT